MSRGTKSEVGKHVCGAVEKVGKHMFHEVLSVLGGPCGVPQSTAAQTLNKTVARPLFLSL